MLGNGREQTPVTSGATTCWQWGGRLLGLASASVSLREFLPTQHLYAAGDTGSQISKSKGLVGMF